MSILYNQDEIDAHERRTRPENLEDPADLENPLFYGLGEATKKGLLSVPPRAADTAVGFFDFMSKPFQDYEQQQIFKEIGEQTGGWVEATRLRPEEAGAASLIINKGVQFVGDAVTSWALTGVPGLLPTGNAAADALREMRREKVGPAASRVMAAGDALNTALAFAYAATGSNILMRMVKGIVANEAADIPIGKVQQFALETAGHKALAEAYSPLAAERLALNIGMGALSGWFSAGPAYDAAAAQRMTRHYHDVMGVEQDLKAVETRGQIQDRMRQIRSGTTWTVDSKYNLPEFDAYIGEVEKLHGLPADMLLALKNAGEKSGVSAVSPDGARGVMQFMPATARDYGLRVDEVVDERLDPWKSMEAAGAFMEERMRWLGKKYGLKRDDPKLERAAIAWYIGGKNDAEGIILHGKAVDDEAIAYLQRTDAFKAAREGMPRVADAAPTHPLTDIPDTAAPHPVPRAAVAAADAVPAQSAVAVPQRTDPVAQAMEDAARIPDVPGYAMDRFGGLDVGKTKPETYQAFLDQDLQLPKGGNDRMRAAVLAKVYGEDVVPLLGRSTAKTPEGIKARALTDALLRSADAVAKSKEKIGPDVAAAAAAAHKGAEIKSDGTPQGALRQNLAAAFSKAKTSKQIQSAITKAAGAKGKAQAVAEVAKEADTFPKVEAIEKPTAELPDGTKLEVEDTFLQEKVEDLAREGRGTIDENGNAKSIADELAVAEQEMADAQMLAKALRTVATSCLGA